MQKMLQQVMTALGHYRVLRRPYPHPTRARGTGKDHEDRRAGRISMYHGEHPFTKYPVTQGHEVSGKIAALGEGVMDSGRKAKVIIEPQAYCGRQPCTQNRQVQSVRGTSGDGVP